MRMVSNFRTFVIGHTHFLCEKYTHVFLSPTFKKDKIEGGVGTKEFLVNSTYISVQINANTFDHLAFSPS